MIKHLAQTASRTQGNKDDFEIARMKELFKQQRIAFRQNPMPSASQRIAKLKWLKKTLLLYKEPLIDALSKDFGHRARFETLVGDLLPIVLGINYTVKRVKKWMKPSRRSVNVLFQPASNWVMYQPLGVVGIIVPWNYPVFLAFSPLISALASGNRAVIKLSEFTPNTNEIIKHLLSKVFQENEVAIVTGSPKVGARFSALPFNHLIFTGSTQVGRHVMQAAAENLTPVTLELGGKSPAIIDEQVKISVAVERLIVGKTSNAGQTCVAPDYVLIPNRRIDEFVSEFKRQFKQMYSSLKENIDYTSIINDRQRNRLLSYIEEIKQSGTTLIELNPANESFGGDTCKLPLYLVINPEPDCRLMQEEIFGPILPIIGFQTIDEAINFVNDRPQPLALYIISFDKNLQKRILETTHSGGVAINDSVFQVAQDDIPFGGIGSSGIGHYHGKEGFLALSKAKGIFKKGRFNLTKLIYPPFNKIFHKLMIATFLR